MFAFICGRLSSSVISVATTQSHREEHWKLFLTLESSHGQSLQ